MQYGGKNGKGTIQCRQYNRPGRTGGSPEKAGYVYWRSWV